MSMSEEQDSKPKLPEWKPARKRRRPVKRVRDAAPAPKQSELADITPKDCPSACRPERCAISGVGICAHPHKGGLQAMLQTPESLRRLNEAKRILGKQKLDLS